MTLFQRFQVIKELLKPDYQFVVVFCKVGLLVADLVEVVLLEVNSKQISMLLERSFRFTIVSVHSHISIIYYQACLYYIIPF